MDAARRTAWLEERRSMIGSSDAAAVLGLSPYRTPLHIYQSKVEPVSAEEEMERSPLEWGPMDFGNLFEETVADLYARVTGRLVTAPASPILRHPNYPHVGASIDRVGYTVDEPARVVECKTSEWPEQWGEPGTDEIPEDYFIQTQHQLLVSDLSVADVPVLFRGNKFSIYTVHRNERLGERLLEVYEDFWKLVLAGTPPPLDWKHPSTPRLVKEMFADVEDVTLDLGKEEEDLVMAMWRLGEERRRIEKETEAIKARLGYRMGNAKLGLLPCGGRICRIPIEVAPHHVGGYRYVRLAVYGINKEIVSWPSRK